MFGWRHLKVLIAFIFVAPLVLMINCSSDENLLVGRWSTRAGGCGAADLELDKDGTGRFSCYYGDIVFTWKVEEENGEKFLVIEPETVSYWMEGYVRATTRYKFEFLDKNTIKIYTPSKEKPEIILYRAGS